MSEVEALLTERAAYLARGRTDRAAQVSAELARLGVAVDDAPEKATAEPKVEKAAPRKPRTRKAQD